MKHAVVALQDPWLGQGWNIGELAILACLAVACAATALWRLRRV